MKIKVFSLAAVLLAVVAFLVVACQTPTPEQPAGAIERGGLLCSTESGNCVESWNGSDIVTYSGSGSGLTFQVDGATGAVLYNGSSYPLGNPVDGRKIEFGRTGNVMSAVVTPVAVTTVTAFGCNVVNPVVAGAWTCGANIGSTRNITFTLYNLAATPVATAAAKPVNFWIAGN